MKSFTIALFHCRCLSLSLCLLSSLAFNDVCSAQAVEMLSFILLCSITATSPLTLLSLPLLYMCVIMHVCTVNLCLTRKEKDQGEIVEACRVFFLCVCFFFFFNSSDVNCILREAVTIENQHLRQSFTWKYQLTAAVRMKC